MDAVARVPHPSQSAGGGGGRRSFPVTPPVHYDLATVRTGASFSLAAYLDLCRQEVLPSHSNDTLHDALPVPTESHTRTSYLWSAVHDLFAKNDVNVTANVTATAAGPDDGLWDRIWSKCHAPSPSSPPQRLLVHYASSPGSAGGPKVALLSAGVLASLYTAYNELLLYSARRMSRRLQDACYRLGHHGEGEGEGGGLATQDLGTLDDWAWSVLLRAGY
ncbi:hypothetical protein B0T24DRAFT_723312 [Lasiosphaeria ovina]|uniref:Uncharacterized protein n=1 Tax=Lasiosphaeria ovina TaxID=92902 RepID=A0AAE0JXN2_9PEZI|nr:hypothetical protein B0T24DRAFT_723312 [Lasiosphaeria ovina]